MNRCSSDARIRLPTEHFPPNKRICDNSSDILITMIPDEYSTPYSTARDTLVTKGKQPPISTVFKSIEGVHCPSTFIYESNEF